MAGRKIEVLEGEIGQLKTDFKEKILDFQNKFTSIHEKMDGRFTALEEMMKKMLEDKQKPAISKTTGGHGRGGNPNPFRGRENPEVEVLEGDDGMPPQEPLSREEMSMGYDRRCADFVWRREEFHRRGADFEGRREEFHRRGAATLEFNIEAQWKAIGRCSARSYDAAALNKFSFFREHGRCSAKWPKCCGA
ncbi:hypothetical protein M5K25_026567 [Dendrobium thyrsiflorum]|uniref:Uncharacterized protein n=1 Tax=Dendrobium thyrsiflorum TaxID=117978 RepID=A0ABD0TXK6_DENTH